MKILLKDVLIMIKILENVILVIKDINWIILGVVPETTSMIYKLEYVLPRCLIVIKLIMIIKNVKSVMEGIINLIINIVVE